MTTRLRRTLLCACLAALAAPASSLGAPAEVAPPGGVGGEGAFSAAARAADPGCRAKNEIEFLGDALSRARHTGLAQCSQVNVRIRCSANLFRGNELVSSLSSRGSDRCRIGSPYAESRRYPAGTQFTQKYRYELTLKNRRKQWAGTTRKCPKRKNDRRTLICKAAHTTLAPEKSVERIRS